MNGVTLAMAIGHGSFLFAPDMVIFETFRPPSTLEFAPVNCYGCFLSSQLVLAINAPVDTESPYFRKPA